MAVYRGVERTGERLEVHAEVEGGALGVRDLTVGVGAGTVGGNLAFDVGAVPAEDSLDLSIARVDLRGAMKRIGIDEDTDETVSISDGRTDSGNESSPSPPPPRRIPTPGAARRGNDDGEP